MFLAITPGPTNHLICCLHLSASGLLSQIMVVCRYAIKLLPISETVKLLPDAARRTADIIQSLSAEDICLAYGTKIAYFDNYCK